MGEMYGNLWVKQYGEVRGEGWKTWCKALNGMSMESMAQGVNRIITDLPKFPPNLPEFKKLCGMNYEKLLGLAGPELSFPHLMNVASKNGQLEHRDLSELSPALYWIYRKIDAYNWILMDTRSARERFNAVYQQCLDTAAMCLTPEDQEKEFPNPPTLLDTQAAMKQRELKEKRKDPVYQSKRKAAGRAAMEEMKAMMGGRA